MKRKLILNSLLVSSIVAPIAITVSCSSSWVKWNKHNDKPTSIEYKGEPNPHVYKFHESDIDGKFVDKKNNHYEIDLAKVRNQYELNAIIERINNFKTKENVDTFWNDLTDKDIYNDNRLINYLKNIKSKTTITLKYESMSMVAHWDITSSIKVIQDGYKEYSKFLGDDSFVKLKGDSNKEHLPSEITKIDIKSKIISLINDASVSKLLQDSDINILKADNEKGSLQFEIVGHNKKPVTYIVLGFKVSDSVSGTHSDSITDKNISVDDPLGEKLKGYRANNSLAQYLRLTDLTKKDDSYIDSNNHFNAALIYNKNSITLLSETIKINKNKFYDVSMKGISKKSALPIDLSNISSKAAPLLSIRAVSSLLDVAPNYAIGLAKLTNLPTNAFNGFKEYVKSIDTFWNQFKPEHNSVIKEWAQDAHSDKGVTWKIDFSIGDKGEPLHDKTGIDYLKGLYLLHGISKG